MRPLFNRRPKGKCESEAADLLAHMGYELEAMRMVGLDDFTMATHYIVLGKKPDSHWQDAMYATWIYIDWSSNPNAKGREGSISQGIYQIPNADAMQAFNDRFRAYQTSCGWVDPETMEPIIPGRS